MSTSPSSSRSQTLSLSRARGERASLQARLDAAFASVGGDEREAIPFNVRFVDERTLRRCWRARHGRSLGLRLPHDRGLRSQAASEPTRPGRSLTTFVLPLPPPELAHSLPFDALLRDAWRRCLHLLVDACLDHRDLPPALVRTRIDAVGQVDFDEVRAVLRDEGLLVGSANSLHTGNSADALAYREFAALAAELLTLAPSRFADFFPSLSPARVRSLLAPDLDLERCLERTRPPSLRSPDPSADPPPAPSTPSAPPDAAPEGLALELARFGSDSAATWHDALAPLASLASSRLRPAWRLLADLRAACQDREPSEHERGVRVADFMRTLGGHSLRYSLRDATRLHAVERLRRAARRLPEIGLDEATSAPLAAAIARCHDSFAEHLRAELGPRVFAALRAGGLCPRGRIEHAALHRLGGELVDRLLARAHLAFSDLRDAVARSDLKLGDTASLDDLVRGNALLSLDRVFAERFASVYRPAEVYLRGLQRASALAFGNPFGRLLVRFVALPLLGAFVVLEGAQHLLALPASALRLPAPHLVSRPALATLAVVLLLLLESARARALTLLLLRHSGRGLRTLFIAAPRWCWRQPLVQRLLHGPVGRLLLVPAVPVSLIVWATLPLAQAPPARLALLLGTYGTSLSVLSSSRLALLADEAFELLAQGLRALQSNWLPALLRWVLALFRAALEQLERALYAVEQRTRDRARDPAGLRLAKLVVGRIWGVFAWLARFYASLLIEPQVNPVKHFPVVTVSHKIILPLSLSLTELGVLRLEPLLGTVLAGALVGSTVFLLPGVFGFLVWELKENWRLYAANRPAELRPERIGTHGETVAGLLRVGFHSGSVAKLVTRRRRLGGFASAEPGLARKRAKLEHRLAAEADSLAHFARRSIAPLLQLAHVPWATQITVDAVRLSTHRIVIPLRRSGQAGSLRIVFEEQSGLLLAELTAPPWRSLLDERERWLLDAALLGLFAKAGVDYLRAELAAALPPGSHYDVADEGLLFWSGDEAGVRCLPLREDAPLAQDLAHRDVRPLRRSRRPLHWQRWASYWANPRGELEALPWSTESTSARFG